MGFDLTNNRMNAHFNTRGWGKVLNLADDYRWIPMGTVLTQPNEDFPDISDWNGNYCSNGFQEVLPEDAMNLGSALEKALADFENSGTNGEIGIDDGDNILADDYGREQIVKLISICKSGEGFIIA